MQLQYLGNISGGQDGAIYENFLFRLDARGNCLVHDLDSGDISVPIGAFSLDQRDWIIPHSNAVVFGTSRYAPEDPFPLLYTNVYNNHAKDPDPRKGTCCVYRIQREQEGFAASLVQLIRIGFTEDPKLWHSSEARADVRPYGNFVIDRDLDTLWAFTMRDADATTRYFAFSLPEVGSGSPGERGIPTVVLNESDIRAQFDCPYHHFIQGACAHRGRIYSVEGFTGSEKNPPALRVISCLEEKQLQYIPFARFGLEEEPEFIDFRGEICYYSDHLGNFYRVDL